MGSIEAASAENGSANRNADQKAVACDGSSPTVNGTTTETDASKKRKASILPLEVDTRVMCRWRDGKYHPVKVIERRKVPGGGSNDYEYYVHYTE